MPDQPVDEDNHVLFLTWMLAPPFGVFFAMPFGYVAFRTPQPIAGIMAAVGLVAWFGVPYWLIDRRYGSEQ